MDFDLVVSKRTFQRDLKEIEDWRSKIVAKLAGEFLFSMLGQNIYANVWFTIGNVGMGYRIFMFYENQYNKADGSDL